MSPVRVQVFGAFRECVPSGELCVDVPAGATVAALREAMASGPALAWPSSAQALLRASVFASESQLLHPTAVLPEGSVIALLPPVSGG